MTEGNKRDFDEKVNSVLLKDKDIAEALEAEGRELTDEELEFISGGGGWQNETCPKCGHTGTLYSPCTGKSRCGKCGLTW
jgi:ribosomal protein S27AE